MPLINGQKMACEPCIRGHRSTKCTHANERLMVPVRKPGRPLSSCPHPSSRPCACAVVTAAIPRKQKCRCGTSDTAAVENQPDHSSSSAAAVTPPSPSQYSGASAGFRVQKQSARSGSSKKQSVDLTGLQRMDPNQVNILSPYAAMSPQISSTSSSSTPMSDFPPYGPMAMTPCDRTQSAESVMFPLFPYAPGPVMGLASQTNPTMNGRAGVSTNGATNREPEIAKSCCCGGEVSGVKNEAQTRPGTVGPSHLAHDADVAPAANGCCSSSAPAAAEREESHGLGGMAPPSGMPFGASGIMMPPFQHLMAMANGMYPLYAQPNIFNYPPQYGSYMQPLQPEQWRHLMAAVNFGGQNGEQPFGGGVAAPLPAQQQNTATPGGSSWTSHHCSCGDACQCVGCTAHPYNDATQDYVRSAWNLMKEEPQRGHGYVNSNGIRRQGSADDANASNGGNEDAAIPSANGTTTPNKPNHDGTWSPVAAHTPSDAASGTSEEQAFPASDFFFVSYPFGDSCAGDSVSCPCGDDCSCIGCAIHNNPDPLPNTKYEPR